MLHATSLAIIVAYYIYLEITEEKLDEDWRVSSSVDFWTFRDVLSIQMLEYNLSKRKYIGDDVMCACTKQKWKDRVTNDDDTTKGGSKWRGRPTAAALWEAKVIQRFNKSKKGRGETSRLCGDLSRLDKHIRSVKTSLKIPKHVKFAEATCTPHVVSVEYHFITCLQR